MLYPNNQASLLYLLLPIFTLCSVACGLDDESKHSCNQQSDCLDGFRCNSATLSCEALPDAVGDEAEEEPANLVLGRLNGGYVIQGKVPTTRESTDPAWRSLVFDFDKPLNPFTAFDVVCADGATQPVPSDITQAELEACYYDQPNLDDCLIPCLNEVGENVGLYGNEDRQLGYELKPNTLTLECDGQAVSFGDIVGSITPNKRVMRFGPAAYTDSVFYGFPAGADCSFRLSTNIRAMDGSVVCIPDDGICKERISFSVDPLRVVQAFTGTDLGGRTLFAVQLNGNVDMASLEAETSLTHDGEVVNYSLNTGGDDLPVLFFECYSSLCPESGTYELAISAGLRDHFGAPLTEPLLLQYMVP